MNFSNQSPNCAIVHFDIAEKGVSQVKFIETHVVELKNRRDAITVDDNETVEEAVKVVKNLGYGCNHS